MNTFILRMKWERISALITTIQHGAACAIKPKQKEKEETKQKRIKMGKHK